MDKRIIIIIIYFFISACLYSDDFEGFVIEINTEEEDQDLNVFITAKQSNVLNESILKLVDKYSFYDDITYYLSEEEKNYFSEKIYYQKYLKYLKDVSKEENKYSLNILKRTNPKKKKIEEVEKEEFKNTFVDLAIKSNKYNLDYFLRRKRIEEPDILIEFQLLRKGSYYLLETVFYSFMDNKEINKKVEVIKDDNPIDISISLASQIFEFFYEEKPARLSVNAPIDSLIYLDGVLISEKTNEQDFLQQGKYLLKIEKKYHKTQFIDLELSEGEFRNVDVDLEESLFEVVYINTKPSNADVYLDSVYQGTTPLTLNINRENKTTISIQKENYQESFLIFDETKNLNNEFYVQLEQENSIEKERDEFYLAIGFLSFSVILPLFTTPMYLDYNNMVGAVENAGFTLTESEYSKLKQLRQSRDYTLMGMAMSYSLNIGFLIWTIKEMVDYIRVSQKVLNQ